MSKKLENTPKNQRIQVFARCRPLNANEKKQSSSSVVEVVSDKKIVLKDKNANREFLFDKVFPPDTKQISVYKAVVEPLIKEVLMGYNCTVFAYGQTGTGKTFTMEGERSNSNCSWEDDPGAGIIPRSLHQLFEGLNKEENIEFSVHVSYLELYNEELFNLLSSDEVPRLRLFGDSSKNGSVHIQGLEETAVHSKDDVYSILEKGTARRRTAATMLNASSSRSHTVFSVTVHIKENTIDGEDLLKIGKLNLVDLAGSENVGRSGAVDKRAREAGNINQSLLTLGRVITALIEKQPHVPYRESKLTRLLQDSLGGNTKTSIIATISPAFCNFDETISTLDYATKAKSIIIKPEANQKMTKRALIREYTEEIERLRRDLVALRCKEGFYVNMENYTSLMNEITEKRNMVKDLLDRIEVLKEEKTKIEEIFSSTKKKLTETCEKLNETTQNYEATAAELSNTAEALSYTQKNLTETTLERDEKQFLINIQCNTEKMLSQQAKMLLNVAEESTCDVEKLHAKIDRKTTIERTNEENWKDFRVMYQKQFALLDDIVSNSEKQQADNLSNTKQDIDKLLQSVQSIHDQTANFLDQFLCLIQSGMGKLLTNFSSVVDSQSKWTNSLLDEINMKREAFSNKQQLFLSEKLPEFIHTVKTRILDLEKWTVGIHEQLSEKIRKEQCVLSENCVRRKKLQNSMKESLELMCKSYEDVLSDFKLQSVAISEEEDPLEEDLSAVMQDLKRSLLSLGEITERRKEIRKTSTHRDNILIKNLENNGLKLNEIQEPLSALSNAEDAVKGNITALNEILNVVNIQEFSKIEDNVHQSQQEVISEFKKFIKEHEEEDEKLISETTDAFKMNLSSISENVQLIEGNIEETDAALKSFANSEKSSFKEQIEKVVKAIYNVDETVNESQMLLSSATNKLKKEIIKSDIEFEKFISEDLLQDIPTGTTPQRKNYCYPRVLVATSPHDRILQRYRSQLAADTAVAVNLPLESSFDELEELKVTPGSSDQRTDDVDIHNVSFSSCDSVTCDTDSCASSLSDVSVDSSRNKENHKISKKSRLPKRLPSSKVFIKPALPSRRKPLLPANSTVAEQTDI